MTVDTPLDDLTIGRTLLVEVEPHAGHLVYQVCALEQMDPASDHARRIARDFPEQHEPVTFWRTIATFTGPPADERTATDTALGHAATATGTRPGDLDCVLRLSGGIHRHRPTTA